ncbi:TonB family protein, partial [Persicitalea sp.]|uniref:energy transducer TonB n=1 Tax=Persicitalea sp. TaxID=3100273 RepID=UPI00359430C2
QGKVFLTFVVNADGSVQDIKVLKGMGFGTDEEAVRIMKQTPKWIPGAKEDGEKVNVKYNLPISFVLPKEKKELGLVIPSKTDKVETSTWLYEQADSLAKLQPNTAGIEYSANSKPAFRIRQAPPGSKFGNPLFVLNGILVPASQPDFLSTISPADVKTITVLKDAVALAVYGVRGANGVVEITTKQGAKMPLDRKN